MSIHSWEYDYEGDTLYTRLQEKYDFRECDISHMRAHMRWVSYLRRACYKGDMNSMKTILSEVRLEDYGLDCIIQNSVSLIGLCHLIGKPKMASYYIKHYGISPILIKKRARNILSATYMDLVTFKNVMSHYNITKDDIEHNDIIADLCSDRWLTSQERLNAIIWVSTELGYSREDAVQALQIVAGHSCIRSARWLVNYFNITIVDLDDIDGMITHMCDDNLSPDDSMIAIIWAFTELGLSREDGIEALTPAAEYGRNNVASWLIDHFKITPFETFYKASPYPIWETTRSLNSYYKVRNMLLKKYSMFDLLILPFQVTLAEIYRFMIEHSSSGTV